MLAAIVRDARRRHHLSQRALAVRAGTTQASVSRIESGRESPSFERFEQLMLAMGERPVLTTQPLAGPETGPEMTHVERLREAASWNLVGAQLAAAGAEARRRG